MTVTLTVVAFSTELVTVVDVVAVVVFSAVQETGVKVGVDVDVVVVAVASMEVVALVNAAYVDIVEHFDTAALIVVVAVIAVSVVLLAALIAAALKMIAALKMVAALMMVAVVV